MNAQETRGEVITAIEDLSIAEQAATFLRGQITSSIRNNHPDVPHCLTGDFPVQYLELPVIHDTEVDPILPHIPVVVALSHRDDAEMISRMSLVQQRNWITVKIGNGEIAYPLVAEIAEGGCTFYSRFMTFQVSDTQSLIARRQHGQPVRAISALGILIYRPQIANDRIITNAEIFPIEIPTDKIIAFNAGGWLWNERSLAKRKAELEEEAERFGPIPLETEHTETILRAWRRTPTDVFKAIENSLSTSQDDLPPDEIEIYPTRTLRWGSDDQIEGSARRFGYWKNGIIPTQINFYLRNVSAQALRDRHLQLARDQKDTTMIHLTLGLLGDSAVTMSVKSNGATGNIAKNITDPDHQEFWIRVLAAMKVERGRKAK